MAVYADFINVRLIKIIRFSMEFKGINSSTGTKLALIKKDIPFLLNTLRVFNPSISAKIWSEKYLKSVLKQKIN